MLATVHSAALQGIHAEPVFVEVNANEIGEPKLILVGLPDAAVKESDDRVVSALSNSGFCPPRTRTTINLAPGGLRKEGPCYDLPIALGYLAASNQLEPGALDGWLIAGELGLSGATRPIRGALAMARLARRLGKRGLLLPARSAEEAALVEGVQAFPIESLDGAVRFLRGETDLRPAAGPARRVSARTAPEGGVDFSEVKGQRSLRRAVEVAVAGGHNLLIIGPPGSGKSMVAKRIPTIMPPPTTEERLEILSIHSAAGRTITGEVSWDARPFRAPHHTVSDVALLGGGTIPGPGEISLAHHGVLFLDELPEFKRSALEVLRQPLEDAEVTISRSAGKVTLPCGFMLVAALNPCPCGYLGDAGHQCRCTPRRSSAIAGASAARFSTGSTCMLRLRRFPSANSARRTTARPRLRSASGWSRPEPANGAGSVPLRGPSTPVFPTPGSAGTALSRRTLATCCRERWSGCLSRPAPMTAS